MSARLSIRLRRMGTWGVLDAVSLPDPLPGAAPLMLRRASADDVPAIVAMLADDPVSSARGDSADPALEPDYRRALEAILADRGNDLIVVVDSDGAVVGTLQLTLIPGMAGRGRTRLQIEAVRVARAARSAGIGTALVEWAVRVAAPTLGAGLVQLTSDTGRADAHRFYERIGFVGSHVGFKLAL